MRKKRRRRQIYGLIENPNGTKTAAYTKEDAWILESIVDLNRELGRPPTFRELSDRTGRSNSTCHHHVMRLRLSKMLNKRQLMLAADAPQFPELGEVHTMIALARHRIKRERYEAADKALQRAHKLLEAFV